MNRRKNILQFLFFFFVLGNLFASPFLLDKEPPHVTKERIDDEDIIDLHPEKLKDYDEKKTMLVVKANVPKAEVFLNGSFLGNTPLEIKDIKPGKYVLEVRKSGYEKERRRIEIRNGRICEFYVSLKKIQGYIVLSGVLSNSEIKIDGTTFKYLSDSKSSHVISIEPGFYRVKVRCFGYEDFEEYVNVFPYAFSNVDVKMQETVFSLTGLESSKNIFNPNYAGNKGKVSFSYNVTANGIVNASLLDEYGTLIRSYKFTNFKTWSQNFEWDGTYSDGSLVADGIYTLEMESEGYTLQCQVNVDKTLTYPTVSINRYFGSISCPSLDSTKLTYMVPYFGFITELKNQGDSLSVYSTDLTFGFGMHISKIFEAGIYGQIPLFCSYDEDQFEFGFNVKLFDFADFDSTLKLGYGAMIHYGYAYAQKYRPYGVNSGNGLGGTLITSISDNLLSGTLSVDYTFGASGAGLKIDDSVLAAGFAFSYKPFDALKINLSTGVDKAFGMYQKQSTFVNAVRVGGNICVMPSEHTFCVSADVRDLFIIGKANYFSFGIILSYLF